mmetsp:Transcript_214/g.785  ORF Transcript_214/g.785 Transcript_214/m.785 type:complete len:244 (+) Transcript_214:657-1388(+)
MRCCSCWPGVCPRLSLVCHVNRSTFIKVLFSPRRRGTYSRGGNKGRGKAVGVGRRRAQLPRRTCAVCLALPAPSSQLTQLQRDAPSVHCAQLQEGVEMRSSRAARGAPRRVRRPPSAVPAAPKRAWERGCARTVSDVARGAGGVARRGSATRVSHDRMCSDQFNDTHASPSSASAARRRSSANDTSAGAACPPSPPSTASLAGWPASRQRRRESSEVEASSSSPSSSSSLAGPPPSSCPSTFR